MPTKPIQRIYLPLFILSSGSLLAVTNYWDTNGATTGLGGDGTWQDASGNWSSDAAGETTTVWTNANRDVADFSGTAGTVTVGAGGVAAESLNFNVGGYTFDGTGVITLGRTTGTSDYSIVNVNSASSAITINNNILINDSDTATSTAFSFTNDGSSSLTFGGDITVDYGTPPTGSTGLKFFSDNSSSSSIVVDGQILSSANSGALFVEFGNASASASNGTIYMNGDNSAVTGNSNIRGGTVVISNANALGTGLITFGSSGTHTEMALLTEGNITFTNALSMSGAADSQTILGGIGAYESTYTATFNMNAFSGTPNPILTAGAGGRVNFSGELRVSGSVARGLTKEGAGIVALTRASGNSMKGLVQVNEGTLLLMNTSGSATGDASLLGIGESAVIVADGARLGGTGITTGLVEASAAGSLFAAGDMTKEGVSSIGTLTLSGGIVAASGATFEVDLNGASVDLVDFGAADVDLDGIVTFNFENLGSVNVSTPYTLLVGTGDWSGSSASFSFNSPSGYMLDTSYGTGGYIWDITPGSSSLTVQFATATVPEPSTFAFLAGCIGLAAAMIRRRR